MATRGAAASTIHAAPDARLRAVALDAHRALLDAWAGHYNETLIAPIDLERRRMHAFKMALALGISVTRRPTIGDAWAAPAAGDSPTTRGLIAFSPGGADEEEERCRWGVAVILTAEAGLADHRGELAELLSYHGGRRLLGGAR